MFVGCFRVYTVLPLTMYLCITIWLNNYPMRLILLSAFHRWGKQVSGRLNDLPKVTQLLIHGGVKTKNQIWLQCCVFPPFCRDFHPSPLLSLWNFRWSLSAIQPWVGACFCSPLSASEGETRLDLLQAGPLRYKCTHADQLRVARERQAQHYLAMALVSNKLVQLK